MAMVAELPVKSCPPLWSTSSRFTGNSAAKQKRCAEMETSPRLPAMAIERRPARPT